ncbi:hypothetical protein BDV19DRAFT_364814 [Aspergillus venezuelensis]
MRAVPAPAQRGTAPKTPRNVLKLSSGGQSTQNSPFNPGQYAPTYSGQNTPSDPTPYSGFQPTQPAPLKPIQDPLL